MAFVEDYTAFFQTNEFASLATLDGQEVRGIFDNGYQAFEVSSGAFATGPVFLMPTSELPANAVGLTLVLGAESWKVVEIEPDGTGLTLLRLRKA